MNKGEANLLLEQHMAELGINFVPEFQFHVTRKWRFDYVILKAGVGIEIDGGIWSRGRHTRGSGFEKDLEKLREAAALGWRVFRFSTREVLDGTARAFLEEHCCAG